MNRTASTQQLAISVRKLISGNPVSLALFRRIATILGFILLAGQLAGCATPTAVMSPLHPYDALKEEVFKGEILTSIDTLKDRETEYYKSDTSDSRREMIREQSVGILLKYINEYWRRYRSSFYGDIAAAKTATEVIAGGLSGASVITTPISAAKLLATLSTGVTALGVSAQKNFLQDNAADLLLAQMEADRQAIGIRIRVGLAKPIKEYGLATAMNDVAEYASAMSVPSALTSIRAATGAKIEADKKALADKARNDLSNELADNLGDIPSLVLGQDKETIINETKLLGEQLRKAGELLPGEAEKLKDEFINKLVAIEEPKKPEVLTHDFLKARQDIAEAKDNNERQIAQANLLIAQTHSRQFKQKLSEVMEKFHEDLANLRAIPSLVLAQDKETIHTETESIKERLGKLDEAGKPLPDLVQKLKETEVNLTAELVGKDPDKPKTLTKDYLTARQHIADAKGDDKKLQSAAAELQSALNNNKQFKQKLAEVMKNFYEELKKIKDAARKKETEPSAKKQE